MRMNCFFNRCSDKYKIKLIEVPTFICANDYVDGISFNFPQDGDKNELIRLLSIYQNYATSKQDDYWKIEYLKNLSNVRDSEIKIPFELNKGNSYVFYYCWERDCNDWDYFYNKVVSKEEVIAKLNEEIKSVETIFGIKFEEKSK